MNQELEAKKEYLRGYERAVRQLKRSDEKIRELRLRQMGVSIKLDGMPHAHNDTDLSSFAAALDAEEEKRNLLVSSYVRTFREICNIIDQLDDDNEKDVLTLRYINLLTLNQISKKMAISSRQVIRIQNSGLKNIKIESVPGQQA